jgi:hypothetical protein
VSSILGSCERTSGEASSWSSAEEFVCFSLANFPALFVVGVAPIVVALLIALLLPTHMERQAGVESIQLGAIVLVEPTVMPEEQAKVARKPQGQASADKDVYAECGLHRELG